MEPDNAGGPLRFEVGAFFAGVESLGWPGVRRTKCEELPGGRSNDYSGFLEYNSVDGGKKRRALHVVFEFVAAALGGAPEFATPDLGLSASRRDPRVAPRTKHAGSHGGSGSFGEGYGFLSWSYNIAPFSLVLLALAKNLLIRGPIAPARLLVRIVALSHLAVAAWADPFFLSVLLMMVRQVALGMVLQASKRLSAKAGSTHELLSFPG